MTTKTDHQQLCQRIRFHLTRDDGRCTRPCGTCGGSGGISSLACSGECRGSGAIENRKRITAAVISWCRLESTSQDYRASVAIDGPFEFWQMVNSDKDAYPVGLPTRSDCGVIEFVLGEVCHGARCLPRYDGCPICYGTGRIGGYVEDAPDYNTPEGMVLLKAMLREANWSYEITWNSVMKSCSASVDTGDLREAAYDFGPEHEALFRAVCLAVETNGGDA